MKSPRRLLISFSGGETSALMTHLLLTQSPSPYDEILVVFANTGEENEATLEFVDACDQLLGFGTHWIEAVQFPGERRAPGFREVTFETASRRGEPFEAMIQKYGIPNQKFKHCTRALKTKPIEAFARSKGWGNGTYDLAIGIRTDEMDRMSDIAAKRRIIYPLVKTWPMTKAKVNHWWSQQPFRLQLAGYQGNCKWCWKKSKRKLFQILRESPDHFDFPARMEREYGEVGAEFLHDPATRREPLPEGYRRVFFRGNVSVEDLKREFGEKGDKVAPPIDENQVFDPEYDLGGGCEESCEVWSDTDETPLEDEEELA